MLRLQDGKSIQDHIKEMTEIFNELAVIEAPIIEEDKVVHLLASLPKSYDTGYGSGGLARGQTKGESP